MMKVRLFRYVCFEPVGSSDFFVGEFTSNRCRKLTVPFMWWWGCASI